MNGLYRHQDGSEHKQRDQKTFMKLEIGDGAVHLFYKYPVQAYIHSGVLGFQTEHWAGIDTHWRT